VRDFEIFRVGKHTAVNGATIDFTAADLAGMAASYDPNLHDAPIVVGHPAMDDPSYGWVRSLRVEGDRLIAVADQVDPAFAEIVRAGRYKTRSAAFYPPDHKSNPKPGGWYLKHIGFLGATPPAVKGLKPVTFASDEGAVEFADWSGLNVATLFSGLRDWMIGQYGQDTADKVLPPDMIDTLKFQAAQPDDDTTSYSEDRMTQPTAAELEERLRALAEAEARFAAQQAAFAESQAAARRQGIKIFIDGLVTSGRFPKAEAPGLAAFMEALPAGDASIEFAEAGGKTAKMAPQTYLMGLLTRLPNLVEFGEVAPGGEAVAFADSTEAISAAAAQYIDEQAARGRTVSSAEAVSHVLSARR
jgi:hypothetical protein